ncbi:MAG: amidase family protein [Clostridiales bacterium]|nr:amidase family protein [Clostridiales bacterium]
MEGKRTHRLRILPLLLALVMVFPSYAFATANAWVDPVKETLQMELQSLVSEAKGVPQSELDGCPAGIASQLAYSTEKAEKLAQSPVGSVGRIKLAALELRVALDALTVDLQNATISDMQNLVLAGKLTYQQLTQMYLTRIELYEHNTIMLNSVRAINPNALSDAAKCDAAFAEDPSVAKGMFGIPVLLKDNINVVGMPNTAGSIALSNNYPPYDAPLVTNLKAAGAVILGKLNMTEFAHSVDSSMPAGFSALGGQVKNPYRPNRLLGDTSTLTPSGSSAGSGAAAAAALAAITVGTETDGSILSPAARNFIAAVKPTVGLISRYGVIPISATQDTPGPMGRNVTDLAILLNAMAGYDPHDPFTEGIAAAGVTGVDYTQSLKLGGLAGKRLGLTGIPAATSATYAPFQAALQALRDAGAEIVTKPNGTALTYYNPSNPNSNPSAPSTSVLDYEFKRDLAAYLETLDPSYPFKTIQDIIDFNLAYEVDHPGGAIPYRQRWLIAAADMDLVADKARYEADILREIAYSRTNGIDYVLKEYNLDGLITTGTSSIGARAGYPTVSVPLQYSGGTGASTNIIFTGTAFTEAKLLEFAYVVEQATMYRVPPGMADKARLQVAIGAAQRLSSSERAQFQSIYNASLSVYQDNFLPQMDIDKADEALRGALLAVTPAGKAQLGETVAFASEINADFLNSAIKEDFLGLLDSAASVNADEFSLPEEVAAAYSSLNSLLAKPAFLQSIVDYANMVKDSMSLKPSFATALESAQQVLADPASTASDYMEAARALNAAIYKSAVVVGIHTAPVSFIGGDVEFNLSVENAENVLNVSLTFEIDGSMLSGKDLLGLNGFAPMNGILWVHAGGNNWSGTVTLALPSGATTGLTSETPVDIAKFICAPKGFGNAAMAITSAKVVFLDDTTKYVGANIKNGTATAIVAKSKYDLNRDGTVDALDLGIMLLYCGFISDSAEWATQVKVSDAWGNGVTASMCDVNGDGVIDMLDLLDLFIHYTK